MARLTAEFPASITFAKSRAFGSAFDLASHFEHFIIRGHLAAIHEDFRLPLKKEKPAKCGPYIEVWSRYGQR